jgi:hypothetical protein
MGAGVSESGEPGGCGLTPHGPMTGHSRSSTDFSGQRSNPGYNSRAWKREPVRWSAGARSAYYEAAFLAPALIFAQRLLAAFDIFALAAADSTCFLALINSRFAVAPMAFAADCKRFKSPCNLPTCFLTFFSSRLITANMLMDPPKPIYLTDALGPIRCLWDVLFDLLAGVTGNLETIRLPRYQDLAQIVGVETTDLKIESRRPS